MSYAPAIFALLLVGPRPTTPPAANASMDVEEVEVLASVSRFDGTLGASPYAFQANVGGARIASVTLDTPNGGVHALVDTGDEWHLILEGFPDLCAISTDPALGFGDYVFTFTEEGSGNVDTVTVPWDPTCTGPHAGYGVITSPLHGEVDVPLGPTLTWNCSGSCAGGDCGNFAWYMEVFPVVGSGSSDEADVLDPCATSWTPGLLSPGRLYGFWLSAGTILGGSPQNLQTAGLDDFVYAPGFETVNEIRFTTEGPRVPASSARWVLALVLGLLGIGGVSALSRARSMRPAA